MFQVFQVFRVFQVFHVRFWTTKPPDFGPNPNKPGKPPESSHRHIMATENPQNSNSPLVYEHDTALFVIAAVLFRRSGFFPGGEVAKRSGKARRQPRHQRWRIVGGCGKGVGFSEILSHPVDAGGRIVCNKALGSVKKKEQ